MKKHRLKPKIFSFKSLFLISNLFFPALLFSINSPKPASAQILSLSISPPLLQIMIQPGRSITQAYEIKNSAPTDLYLQTTVAPFTASSENGQIVYQETSSPLPQPQFFLNNANIQLGETFKLAAGQSRQLVLKIHVPQEISETDYYYTFFINSSSPAIFLNRTASSTLARIGSHLLITVSKSGTPRIEGAISHFKAIPKIADLFDSVKFEITAANIGEAFFKAGGKIEIYDWLGKKRQELKLRPDNVLINSQRQLVCVGKTDDEQTEPPQTPCVFSSLFPGRYRAVATIPIDNPETPDSETVYFYLLPLKLLTAILVSLVFLVLIRKRKTMT